MKGFCALARFGWPAATGGRVNYSCGSNEQEMFSLRTMQEETNVPRLAVLSKLVWFALFGKLIKCDNWMALDKKQQRVPC